MFAMFTASVGTLAANGDERKNTVFKSSKALRTHCTANRLTTKVAIRGRANRATAHKLIVKAKPANKVNGMPLTELHDPAMSGLTMPKIIVSTRMNAAEASNTILAATARRIKTSSSAPYVIAPR